MARRMCACSRYLDDGAYICVTCADELGSLALRAAGLYNDLEAHLLGRPGKGNGGRSATRIHADLNLNEAASDTRLEISRTLYEMAAGSVVERACFIARNRYAQATKLFAPQWLRKLRDAVSRATQLLEPVRGRWLDQDCPSCTGTLGVILRGSQSVVVCSQRADHVFSIREWVRFV